MTRTLAWAAAALLCLAPIAAAQESAPDRNANTYDGTHHQPTAGATGQAEQSAGVATQGQQQQQTNALDQLGAQVQQKAQQSTGGAAGCTPNGAACPP